jgi:hypothetical protein
MGTWILRIARIKADFWWPAATLFDFYGFTPAFGGA